MAECLRTRVQFPPSPPITKVSRFSVGLFYWLIWCWIKSAHGFKKLSGAIFNVRLLHGPIGVKYRDVDGRTTQEQLSR